MQKKLKRICPYCKKSVSYSQTSIDYFKKAQLEKTRCKKCKWVGRKRIHTASTKEKISKSLRKKYKTGKLTSNMSGAHSRKSRLKRSKTLTGKSLSIRHKNNISVGVKKSKKHKAAMRRPELRAKRTGDNNCAKRPEVRRKLRLYAIKRAKELGGQICPRYNPKACAHFDLLMSKTDTHIQHAQNGGEFYIKELGYFLDGYDRENNIAYEWDEDHHFDVKGKLLKKDIRRQKEIEKLLNCTFIRIKQPKEIR